MYRATAWWRWARAADAGAWATAVDALDELSRPFPAAYARFRQAGGLLGAGEREQAASLPRAAWEVAVPLGAEPLREDIKRLARRARVDLDAVL